jgi:hypothetical protein
MGLVGSAGDRARELGARPPSRQQAIGRLSRRDHADGPFSCR